MKGKSLILTLLLAGVSLASPLLKIAEACPFKEKIKVGVILPLSGAVGIAGQAFREGMQLKQKELGKDSCVYLYFEDSTSDNLAVKTVSAFNSLVNIRHIKILVNSIVNTVKPIKVLVERKKIPTFILWDNSRKLANLSPYIWFFGYGVEANGEKLARYVRNKLKLTHISIISLHDDWSELISSAFKNEFIKRGGIIDYHFKVNPDATDLRTEVLKVKSKKSEGLYFPVWGGPVVGILKAVNQLNFNGILITSDGVTEQDINELYPLSEGMIQHQLFLNDEKFVKLVKHYLKKDVTTTRLAYIATGYDMISYLQELLLEAAKKGKKPYGDELNSLIPTVIRTGFTGTTDFSKGHFTSRVQSVVKVKDKRFHLLEK